MYGDYHYHSRTSEGVVAFFEINAIIFFLICLIGGFYLFLMLFLPGTLAIIFILFGLWHFDSRGMIITGSIFGAIQVLGIVGLIFYSSVTERYQNDLNFIFPETGKTAYIVLNNKEFEDFDAYDFYVSVNNKKIQLTRPNSGSSKSEFAEFGFIIPKAGKKQKQKINEVTFSYIRKGKMAERRVYFSTVLDKSKTKLFCPARFLYSDNEILQYESNYSLFAENKNRSTRKKLEGMDCFEEYLAKNPNMF